jgi:outer membrane protein OmpA-like peptidoglycan-associated protein
MKTKFIMTRTLLLLFILFISTTLYPQGTALKKGNKYFDEQRYSAAISQYEKVYSKDSSNKLLLSNLGDCYRLVNNINGQIKCYGLLVKYGKAEPIHKLYYAKALMESGRNDEAKTFLSQYNEDNRGKNLLSSFEKLKQYSKNADAYKVELTSFNSPQNDFCAVNFNNSVVFASTRYSTKWINVKDGWTNDSYLNLYTTEKVNGIELKPKIFMGDLNSKFHDGPVCFTKDYATMYFTRNNYNKKTISKDDTYKLKIFCATLNKNGFDRVYELPFNKNDYNFTHPSISPDGQTIFFASDMSGGKGGMDIYMCSKNTDGSWGTPVNLGDKINTAGNEVFPFIASNGFLYFSSDGLDGLGGLDIYETKIKDGAAGRVYNMGEPVNSKNDDFGIFLGEDNKTGYISSNRKNGGKDDDIYNFQTLREVKRGKEVILALKDKDNNEPLPNTQVKINDETFITNEKGEYPTLLEEDLAYKIIVEKEDYYAAQDSMSTASSSDDSFTKTILLEKDPKLALIGLIADAKTNEPLDGVKMTVRELPGKEAFDTYTTDTKGYYRKSLKGKKIGDKISYEIILEKDKYLTKNLVFIYDIKSPGEINLNASVDMHLGKVEVGMDLAKMIEIKPIYFDLGKFTIRKDAAIELDKVASVMKEYPNMYIELGSHTDCRGAAKANTALSDKRAKASAAYIIKKGIDKTRVIGKGYGESKLLNSCACEGKVQSNCSEDDHAKNRRTEFIITKLK